MVVPVAAGRRGLLDLPEQLGLPVCGVPQGLLEEVVE